MTNPILALHELGQSIWYDNIERRLLENGEFSRMIEAGEIRGVTSNPSIFQNAIANSSDYDELLRECKTQGLSAAEIFEALAVRDIREAADLFRPLYDSTSGGDGYVSLEVNPHLANDTDGTIEEASRLWETVDRPNLMIKIPATAEGIPAIQESIARGVNVNITLIFSNARYAEVIEAYFSGLEEHSDRGGDISRIASVASFFVSRVDTKMDSWLEDIIRTEAPGAGLAQSLLGTIAVANAKLAYGVFRQSHSVYRFKLLQDEGAAVQRPLWASTSTKNPAYPDVKYVEELIGPDTVNTVPPKTLDAYRDHGQPEVRIDKDMDATMRQMTDLGAMGLSLDRATHELELEGVKAFADAYDSLLGTIQSRMDEPEI